MTGVDTTSRIGPRGHERVARGTFQVVTLRLSSDARRATLTPVGLEAVLVAGGRRYRRDLEAERALGAGTGAVSGLEEALPPGGSYARRLVFDVPAGTRGAALDVRDGWPVDRAIEAVIIGDDDSLFHPRTMLGL